MATGEATRGVRFILKPEVAPDYLKAFAPVHREIDRLQQRMGGVFSGAGGNGAGGGNRFGGGNGMSHGMQEAVKAAQNGTAAIGKHLTNGALAHQKALEKQQAADKKYWDSFVTYGQKSQQRRLDQEEKAAQRQAQTLEKFQAKRESELQKAVAADQKFWDSVVSYGQKSMSKRAAAEEKDLQRRINAGNRRLGQLVGAGPQAQQQDQQRAERDLQRRMLAGNRQLASLVRGGPQAQRQDQQRAERDEQIALARQREGYHRLGESIGATTDAVTRLAEGFGYLGLIGQRDLGKLTDSLLRIRGTVEAIRGGVGSLRDIGSLAANLRGVHGTGGAGGIARALLGLGPRAGGAAIGTGGLLAGGLATAGTAALAFGGMAGLDALRPDYAGFGHVGGHISGLADKIAEVGMATAGPYTGIIAAGANARLPYGLTPRQREIAISHNRHIAARMNPLGVFAEAEEVRRDAERMERNTKKDMEARREFLEGHRREAEFQERIRDFDLQQQRFRATEAYRPLVGVSQLRNITRGRIGVSEQIGLLQGQLRANESAFESRRNIFDISGQRVELSREERQGFAEKQLTIEREIMQLRERGRDFAKQEYELARSRYEQGRNERGSFARMNPLQQQYALSIYRRAASGQSLNEFELRALEGSGISRFGELAANQREQQSRAMFLARGGTAAEFERIFGQTGYQEQEERRLQRERDAIGLETRFNANQEIRTPRSYSPLADGEQQERRAAQDEDFRQRVRAEANVKVDNRVAVTVEASDSLEKALADNWNTSLRSFLDNQNERIESFFEQIRKDNSQQIARAMSRVNQQGRLLS